MSGVVRPDDAPASPSPPGERWDDGATTLTAAAARSGEGDETARAPKASPGSWDDPTTAISAASAAALGVELPRRLAVPRPAPTPDMMSPTGLQPMVGEGAPSLPRPTAAGVPPAPASPRDALAAPSVSPTGHTIAGVAAPPPTAAHPPVGSEGYIGSVIADRYRVLKKLGEGGMGVVYLAEHIVIEKKVALKVLSEDFARKADLVQRFMQEAKAASRIGHENIVDITDFGETPSGSVFFAMEFLDGRDLATHIRDDGRMPFSRARPIVTQICRALGAAHAKGIIHRDMKPENIFLVEREGRSDFVKVLDFGIAKMSALEDGGGARLTRTGMIFGTPEYMSPEQAKGDRPDHRVDIYAVGCILYEMLTGDVPFRADTFMGVLTKHMFEPAEPLSKRAPDANVPADVEAVVMKAIAKDREQRFQTMKEMSVALAACGGVPASEAWGDEPSQVGSAGDPTYGGSMTSARPVDPRAVAVDEPPRSRAGLWFALGGVALGLSILAVWILVLRPSPKPAVVPPPVVAAPVERPAASPETRPVEAPVAAPAHPSTVTLKFKTTPDGAEVRLGGTPLGTTPVDLQFPYGDAPVHVALSHAGYAPLPLDVTPDKDREYVVTLVAGGAAQRPSRGGSKTSPHAGSKTQSRTPSEGTQAPAVTQPVAQPPPAQPPPRNNKLRDLKDPFAT